MIRRHLIAPAVALACVASARAGVVYATGFDDYITTPPTLSGQLAWIGTGGTWGVSASVNTGQTGFAVMTSDGAVLPPSGSGKFVRMTTSKYGADRTKGWLDLLNSGKWAAASTGGNSVMEATIKMFIPANITMPCQFGLMVSKDAATTGSGFVVNAQTGAVSYLDGGYGASNRYAFGGSPVSLGAWHSYRFLWNPTTGAASLEIDGVAIGSYTSTNKGGLYAVNIFSFTDWSGTSASNVYAYVDDYAVSAISPVAPCPGDFNNDRVRDGADLGLLLGAWGTATCDLNADGTTDGADLGLLLGSWGACP